MDKMTRDISQCSRQELYDLIWTTPASQLANDFGISDVAIAKRCNNRNIPRPTRGYWAKVAAGRTPRKKPLPPTPGELFKQNASGRVPKSLALPAQTEALHPLAAEAAKSVMKGQLDSYKRSHFREAPLPEVTVSKTLADRVARAFHTILTNVESVGIPFKKARSSYDGGYFERRNDRLHLTIVEDLVRADGTRESTPWFQTPHGQERPSGYLTFLLNPERYGSKNTQHWCESSRLPLETVLAQVVAAIRAHFVATQERREQEAIQRAKDHADWLKHMEEWKKQEAIRREQERQQKHTDAITAVVQSRKTALQKAADNWRQSNTLLEFIAACEARWKTEGSELSQEQSAWLNWAREIAATMSPFSLNYPEPVNDGAFDPALIPIGGPYPPIRNFK